MEVSAILYKSTYCIFTLYGTHVEVSNCTSKIFPGESVLLENPFYRVSEKKKKGAIFSCGGKQI